MSNASILLKNIAINFEDNYVLKDININIEKGEKASIVGPGGSGKSTILKIVLGLLTPSAGEVELLGLDMQTCTNQEQLDVLNKVGMAFQQGALFDFMTVAENLLFAMENMTNVSKEDANTRILELLEQVKLSRTYSQFPYELSGGMQRRIGIARALCTKPQLAIFDEPTSGLDPVTSTIILNMIKDLNKNSTTETTQIVVTSNIEIGVRFCERMIVINDGVVVADGLWSDLLVNGSEWVKNFLGTRFIGLDIEYAKELKLPKQFISQNWN